MGESASPTGPRTGEACDTRDFERCSVDPQVPDGPSTGDSCPVEGGTQCAADSATDPYFYLCRDGVLQVFDHARFRGGAQCEMGEFGPPVVRYFDF